MKKAAVLISVIIICSALVYVSIVHQRFRTAVEAVVQRVPGVTYHASTVQHLSAVVLHDVVVTSAFPVSLSFESLVVRPVNMWRVVCGLDSETEIDINVQGGVLHVFSEDGVKRDEYSVVIGPCRISYTAARLREAEIHVAVEDAFTVNLSSVTDEGKFAGDCAVDFEHSFLLRAPKKLLLHHVVLPQDDFSHVAVTMNGVWPVLEVEVVSRLITLSLAYDVEERARNSLS